MYARRALAVAQVDARAAQRAPAHEVVAAELVLHAHALERSVALVVESGLGPAAVVMQLAVAAEAGAGDPHVQWHARSEEHTSELQSLMRSSYAVFCLKKKHLTFAK